MMKNNKQRFSLGTIGYIDLSLNLMLGFAALFIILLMILKTETVSEPTNMDVRGHIVIKLTWNENYDSDIDLWVKAEEPLEIVGFKNKQGKRMFLDYDDTGSNNDTLSALGTIIKTVADPVNQEIMYIKLKVESRFVVNIHYYRKNSDPVDCLVEIISIDPKFRLLKSKEIKLEFKGQEKTAFVFYTDENGNVTKIEDNIEEPFVYDSVSSLEAQ